MIEAQPFKGGRKGADGGIDGYLYFKADGRVTEKAVVSVKGGEHADVKMIRDLIATVQSEGAKLGIFITLAPPTKPMVTEAAAAGLYQTSVYENRKFSKIQILTIADLFDGHSPDMPFRDAHHVTGAAVKRAEVLGVDLPGMPLAEFQALCQGITPAVFEVLTPAASAGSRQSYGGAAPDQVRLQVARWREKLS